MLSRVLPQVEEPESEALERQRWVAAVRGTRERAGTRAPEVSTERGDLVTGFWMTA